jgi:hypothetical protein
MKNFQTDKKCHFPKYPEKYQQNFKYIVAVCFVGRGNPNT